MAPSLLRERGVAPSVPAGRGRPRLCSVAPDLSALQGWHWGAASCWGPPSLLHRSTWAPSAESPREGTAGWVSLMALLGHGGLFPLSSDATSRGCVLSAAPSHGLAGAELEMLPQLGSSALRDVSLGRPATGRACVIWAASWLGPWSRGRGSWAGWLTPAGHQSGHSLGDTSPSPREGNPFPG